MSFNPEALSAYAPIRTERAYSDGDTMLYALALGLGSEPTDPQQLRFVYEKDLLALPTMATVLGARFPFIRDPAVGIDMRGLLHGEASLTVHAPLPASGKVVGTVRVDSLIDRGAEKGAALYFTHEISDAQTHKALATVTGCFILRRNGGFGGSSGPAPRPHPTPERTFDYAIDLPTLPQAALIYRLTGDRNPLHADPDAARAATFERPILHGACTYGVAGHAILKSACAYEPARLKRLDVRFSAPLFPGETVRTEVWKKGRGRLAFRCRAKERDIVVISNGYAEIGE